MADEDESDEISCYSCKRDITGDDADSDTEQFTCEECDELFCIDCCVQFESLTTIICKDCIDEVYPREKEIVEKVVEKIIEVPKETIRVMGFSEPIL